MNSMKKHTHFHWLDCIHKGPCSVQGNYLPVMSCHLYNVSEVTYGINPHATLVKNARKFFFVWGCGVLTKCCSHATKE